MPITASNPFRWRHYPGDIIMWCVRWYLRYPLSVAQMAEMTAERGLAISPSCIWRWVQIYGPELDKRCRRHRKPTNKSWRLRDAAAAKRFFRRALANPGNRMPRVINVDKNRAYPVALGELKEQGTIRRRCRLRPCKYLNNIVEQDHRSVKRRTWLAKGYGSVPTAWRTPRGIEAMDMIRKGRARRVAKGDTVAQVKFIDKLFGIAA